MSAALSPSQMASLSASQGPSDGLATHAESTARTESTAHATNGEKQRSVASRLNWLRAGVLGANDGIVSISGLLVGVAAVDPANTTAIALAGVAGIVAASLSMSVGEYVSVSTQLDTEQELVRKQWLALADNPAAEEARLAKLWVDRGLSETTAKAVAAELSAHDAIDAHLTTEHNIDPDDLTSPWAAAISSFIAFVIGSLLPFITMLVSPVAWRIGATFVAVTVALALTGWLSAWLGQAPRLKATARLVIGGGVAMGLTYWVGHLFGVNI
ncbi:VIT1/CCC1 transporter family protein [Schaalia canis]|nr:VIT family protein [Schaalia canis]